MTPTDWVNVMTPAVMKLTTNTVVTDEDEIPPWHFGDLIGEADPALIQGDMQTIRTLMWNYVGIVRSDKRLARAHRRIENIQAEIDEYYWDFRVTPDLIELRNIAMVAELIVKCAMHRKESRGLHYNIQYPQRDDRRWCKDTVLRRPFVG